jgi:hypothetical protein
MVKARRIFFLHGNSCWNSKVMESDGLLHMVHVTALIVCSTSTNVLSRHSYRVHYHVMVEFDVQLGRGTLLLFGNLTR